MPPLKLVIMSATLRVEDFAGNTRLFPNTQPNLVRVPGRTHPVTIHHSKVTELDDYMEATYKKVCKIHRKLPNGGILVFLTGKAEIIRMVNRLRKALAPRRSQNRRAVGDADVSTNAAKGGQMQEVISIKNLDDAGALRDMDDDEVDGDLFAEGDRDDYEDQLSDSADEDEDVGQEHVGVEWAKSQLVVMQMVLRRTPTGPTMFSFCLCTPCCRPRNRPKYSNRSQRERG